VGLNLYVQTALVYARAMDFTHIKKSARTMAPVSEAATVYAPQTISYKSFTSSPQVSSLTQISPDNTFPVAGPMLPVPTVPVVAEFPVLMK
jgi:hypothetical protein